jgi:uncharacterized OsmC-like protein
MTETATQTVNDVRPSEPRREWIKSVRAIGSWQGSMTTDIRIRDFTLRSDEPEAVGGTNSAPTPMEILAGAVNGCITVVIDTVATELAIPLRAVETASAAHMDVRGFRGTADVSPHFLDYTLTVRIASSASAQQQAQLRTLVEKRCPAINLIRDAGVRFDLDWQFSE